MIYFRLLEHILTLAERFDETDYIILAGTRLISSNPRQYAVHLDKVSYSYVYFISLLEFPALFNHYNLLNKARGKGKRKKSS